MQVLLKAFIYLSSILMHTGLARRIKSKTPCLFEMALGNNSRQHLRLQLHNKSSSGDPNEFLTVGRQPECGAAAAGGCGADAGLRSPGRPAAGPPHRAAGSLWTEGRQAQQM